tara:strand:- start:1126 stop:1707 length:582 start_codon:yes stop_codon:yes gene_type:complete
MPFITEELWSSICRRQKLLIHTDWPEYGTDLINKSADREINWTINFIETIRSIRGEMNVPAGLKIPLVMLNIDKTKESSFNSNLNLIKKLARLDTIIKSDIAPTGCVSISIVGGEFALPLSDIINIDNEKLRLEKNLYKISGDVKSLKGRIENKKFLQSAPENVILQTKIDYKEKIEEIEKIKKSLTRLNNIK